MCDDTNILHLSVESDNEDKPAFLGVYIAGISPLCFLSDTHSLIEKFFDLSETTHSNAVSSCLKTCYAQIY